MESVFLNSPSFALGDERRFFSLLTALFSHGVTIFSFLFFFLLKAKLQRRAHCPGEKDAIDWKAEGTEPLVGGYLEND